MARHTTTLSFADLFKAVENLLAPAGRFAIVVPEAIRNAPFHCVRETVVRTKQGKKPERFLLEFSRQEKITVKDELVLLAGDKRSPAYQNLTQDFYL
jgi:tRNA1Val (adenine37-N6)-methyltransferase